MPSGSLFRFLGFRKRNLHPRCKVSFPIRHSLIEFCVRGRALGAHWCHESDPLLHGLLNRRIIVEIVGGRQNHQLTNLAFLFGKAQISQQRGNQLETGECRSGSTHRVSNRLWTYLSPAEQIYPDERTGRFRLGWDQPVIDADGQSRISFEDFAVALIDEAELPRHIQRRFTVGY